MKIAGRLLLTTAALCVSASLAVAADVAPANVKVVDGKIEAPLVDRISAGRKYFANRKLGNCLACHTNSEMNEQLFHGEVGPPLEGVASRYTEPELRAIVVNAKAVFGPETVMPGFYSLDVGKNVRKDLVGKTILTAEQVEGIVAYLGTLK